MDKEARATKSSRGVAKSKNQCAPQGMKHWDEYSAAASMEAQQNQVLDSTRLYLNEIGYSPLLTAKEEIFYARKVQQGDAESRRRMIESNLRLVVKISRRYVNRGLALLDLIEEGNLGLIHAVEKYDPEKGFRFSTYATWWIRQNIERAIMNQTRTIRLPIHVVKELNVYLRAARELSQKSNHEPTADEIAALIEKPVAGVARLLSLNDQINSVDLPASDGDNAQFEAVADAPQADPSVVVQGSDLLANLDARLDQLSQKHREVLVRRFGLRGHKVGTLEQVGAAIGLTRERVRQIQLDGLQALRVSMEQEGLNCEDIFA